ncbi:putative peptidyl-tRNA hydrolase 2 [Hypsizygus marmoreus]|uniref:peptidyl-tRNA hydrolase n=1 Tax=Hypsizygus marmoreus TaxID=39966 RepID=A0A369KCN1_HYPMA|nr:putative peptidyl-tRNA hydrolase 2 [Hypsizygus marmoreus]
MLSVSHFKAAKIALALVLSLTSLGLGYWFGSQSTSFVGHVPELPKDTPPITIEDDNENEEEHEDIADGDLSAIQAGFLEQCKLVLVVRTDLKMSPGKFAAQCGHATLACYKALVKANPKLVQHWERTGQAKIALKATSEEQLLELEAIAKSLNLCARSVEDQGLTQVAEGSRTVLGIGPAPVALINEVTGKLRLL